jgi:hypothetical protein
MDKPWKVILAFVGVFMAGVIFGGVFAFRIENQVRHEQPAPAPTVPPIVQHQPQKQPHKVQPPPGQSPAAKEVPLAMVALRQYTRRLNLTAEQQKRIQPLLARAFEDRQRMSREFAADTQRVYDRMNEDIAAVLSPEQRTQLEKMRQEGLERTRQARMKAGGGGAEAKVEGANRVEDGSRPTPSVQPTRSTTP